MQLPLNLPIELMQTKWAAILNPLAANILVQGSYLPNLSLVASTPKAFNHLLGRKMQGYIVCGQSAGTDIWYTQPFNATTLTLQAGADVNFNLWVF